MFNYVKIAVTVWIRAGAMVSLLICASLVQGQEWQWARSIGGKGADTVGGLAAIGDGGVFLTLSFNETIKIGTNQFRSRGAEDILLLRADYQGDPAWAISLGGDLADFARGCISDAQTNVIVAGGFSATAWIGDHWVSSAGGQDVFVAKYSPSGAPLWNVQAGGATGDEAKAVALDAAGNVIVTGVFSSPEMRFDQITITNKGQGDIFLAKYSAAGQLLWATSAGGTGDDFGSALATDDQGNIYVTGGFHETAEFGTNQASTVSGAVFLAKYDARGSNQWVVVGQSDAGIFSTGLAVMPGGEVCQSGYYLAQATIGDRTLTAAGIYDVFLAAYDSAGAVQWVQSAGGASIDQAAGLASAGQGGVLSTGYLIGSAQFGTNVVTGLGQSAFVAQYDQAGQVRWVLLPSSGLGNEGKLLAFAAPDRVFVAGEFSGAMNFEGTSLTSAGARDVFLASISLGSDCDSAPMLQPLTLRKIDAHTYELSTQTSERYLTELQYTADFKSWAALTNVANQAGVMVFTDRLASEVGYRFYRSVQRCP
jgi:hypothetical protein